MKASLLIVGTVVGCLSIAAQGPPGPPAGGHAFGLPGAMEMGMHSRKVVTDAPYAADVSTSMAQTLADGNTINRVTTGRVARDSQGRTYLQQNIQGGPWAQNGSTTITFISDPIAGYTYVLNPSTKVAMRRQFKTHSGERPSWGKQNATNEKKQRVEADLGQQTIGSLNATGKSVTRTTAAGEVGNAQPIVEKSEIWTSPDLQVVVLSKRTDPRFGVSTYALKNIQREEPSASLFQIPSNYTVEDAPAPGFRH
jgi:hypothetical protein